MATLINKNLLSEIKIESSIDSNDIMKPPEPMMYVTIGSTKRAFKSKEVKYVKPITTLVQTAFNDKQFVDVDALMESIQLKLTNLQKVDDDYTNK